MKESPARNQVVHIEKKSKQNLKGKIKRLLV